MAQILNGRALADKIKSEVKKDIETLQITPGLGVILVGDNVASHMYISLKEKTCAEVGIYFKKTILPEDATTAEVIHVVRQYNLEQNIHGILVQVPLPEQINESAVISAIDPQKDVDGFHPQTLTDLKNNCEKIIPGLVAGIIELIKSSGENLTGKNAAVIANSLEFFEPLEIVFDRLNITAQYFNVRSATPEEVKKFDLVVVAIGRPNFITADFIKPGAIVIDVGTNKVDGKVVGDVDFASVQDIAGFLSPVPGGVGPMTVAMLMKNTLELAKHRRSKA